jgi:peroxiredoxin
MTWPYPAPVDDGAAAHLVAGLVLPDVLLTSTGGDAVNLAVLPGLSVIFVYPWTGRPGLPNPPGWDDIPGAHGSTPEAEGFRDLHAKFVAHGARVFGLSTQDGGHQREFAGRMTLPFGLLSDEAMRFRQALSLPSFQTGGVPYLKRLTLVVRAGRIATVFYPVHPPDLHAAEVLAWLRSR